MLRRSATRLSTQWKPALSKRVLFNVANVVAARQISSKPEQSFTKLTNENDPNREKFFQYTWGTWLKNDKLEKEKRTTKFSIEGLNDIITDLYSQPTTTTQADSIPPPINNKNNTVSLPQNLTPELLGSSTKTTPVQITRLSSIHEGKYHRVYKIDTNLNTSFILRIPYPLTDQTTQKFLIESEVATMDYVSLKLKINVPKIFSYASDAKNPLGQPFILQQFIDGPLLMRQWNPLADDKEKPQLQNAINIVSDFQQKLNKATFKNSGSLYFSARKLDPPTTAEEVETIDSRWYVGPSVEKSLWRNKLQYWKLNDLLKLLGPWKQENVTSIIQDTAKVQLETLKKEEKNAATLSDNILTFQNLTHLAPSLFESSITKIPNLKELLKPRLFHPDLDPMNVIIDAKTKEPYLLDFEATTIKPTILQHSPQFIRYDGPKIYDLQKDTPEYKELSDAEKQQYEFIYKRTRNEYMWENAMNERTPDLITTMAPPIKLLRSPYVASLEMKDELEEYLLVDEAMIQLSKVWSTFYENGLVKEKEFPLKFTEDQIKKHNDELTAFHEKLIRVPFAATKGWVPQDMFDNLLKNGIIVKDKDGNYSIASEPKSKST
ncbi:hypothetical protein NCAS_0E03470 [Naumovozyma castellii]|uniref:Altered inheritance of mitochondria protein 9, mitochondrial n=1 Tax=Naumovozyma castellii TaxID=27288 RepID=G0VFZ8_NAUCA|nr:hypothetical protein NCAS_0E03470 [Naumovozyma castellii CBS 4309]CCC70417.1 hypothetical protein NCAS_0E03470 [Naumovozyma castellii CBS 4309]